MTTQPVHDRTDRTPTWMVQGVFDPDVTGRDFSYTIGLHGLGLPELHLWASPTVGADPGDDWHFSMRDSRHILNELAFGVLDGKPRHRLRSREALRPGPRRGHLPDPAARRSGCPRGLRNRAGRAGSPRLPGRSHESRPASGADDVVGRERGFRRVRRARPRQATPAWWGAQRAAACEAILRPGAAVRPSFPDRVGQGCTARRRGPGGPAHHADPVRTGAPSGVARDRGQRPGSRGRPRRGPAEPRGLGRDLVDGIIGKLGDGWATAVETADPHPRSRSAAERRRLEDNFRHLLTDAVRAVLAVEVVADVADESLLLLARGPWLAALHPEWTLPGPEWTASPLRSPEIGPEGSQATHDPGMEADRGGRSPGP